jgi:hypothetical protein
MTKFLLKLLNDKRLGTKCLIIPNGQGILPTSTELWKACKRRLTAPKHGAHASSLLGALLGASCQQLVGHQGELENLKAHVPEVHLRIWSRREKLMDGDGGNAPADRHSEGPNLTAMP